MNSLTIAPYKREILRNTAALTFGGAIYFLAFLYMGWLATWAFIAGEYSYAMAYLAYTAFCAWSFTPIVLYNFATIILLPAKLRQDYLQLRRVYSLLNRVLNRLPVQRSWYKTYLQCELARCNFLEGEYIDAENLYREVLADLADRVPADRSKDPRAARTLALEAFASVFAGFSATMRAEYVSADLLLERAREIVAKQSAVRRAYGGLVHLYSAALSLELEELDQAEEYLTVASQSFKTDSVVYSAWQMQQFVSFSDGLLALLYARKSDMKQADEYCNRYLQHLHSNTNSAMSMHWLNRLAAIYLDCRDFAQAERILETAYWIGSKTPMHPDCPKIIHSFERLLIATDRSADIADMKRWIRPIALLTAHEA